MARSKFPGSRHLPKGLRILHEDRAIIVVSKPSGMLTVFSKLDRSRTVQDALENYIRKGQARSRLRLYAVHRLDKFTSGVLVFAKTEEAMNRLKDAWETVEKTYLAAVNGRVREGSGVEESYLAEDARHRVFSTNDSLRGKYARTDWRVLRASPKSSLLEVQIPTGRKNQIRVHMAGLGHPIIGDRKYGGGGSGRDRLALHAWKIVFPHPVTRERMAFTVSPPHDFTRMAGSVPDENTE